jgi:hypothetical protein
MHVQKGLQFTSQASSLPFYNYLLLSPSQCSTVDTSDSPAEEGLMQTQTNARELTSMLHPARPTMQWSAHHCSIQHGLPCDGMLARGSGSSVSGQFWLRLGWTDSPSLPPSLLTVSTNRKLCIAGPKASVAQQHGI